MPKRKTHNWLNKRVLGSDHDEVNAALDRPSKHLGRRHRKLLHDPVTAVIAASLASQKPDAPRAALLHILLDRFCSETPVAKEAIELYMALEKRGSTINRSRSARRTKRRKYRRQRHSSKQDHNR